jgi:catechol 2,3-dioxygenase-like lactoylglutathione lyase family enzyme
MIDHIGYAVAQFLVSRAFYASALAPLGYTAAMEGEGWVGLGPDGKPVLWLSAEGSPPGRIHLAFRAETRAQVRAFHAAALSAGGTDNGAPGLRPDYHPDYYGAFVIDPDGHNIEGVCHAPESIAGA